MPMLRRLAAALSITLVASLLALASPASAAVDPSATLLINEVYGGGGNSGAPVRRDFVELFNRGEDPVTLDGWSVQYRSATGTGGWQVTPLSGTIAAGGYLLVGQATGSDTTLPDIGADVVGTIAMSSSGGKVALASSADALACASGCAADAAVVDFVGWGAANDWAGTAAAPATSNPTSISRDEQHLHTADNAADFAVGAPTPTASTTDPGPDPDPEDPELVTIADIQGNGAVSPLAGSTVTTRGVVTAAYPTGGFGAYVIQSDASGGDTSLDGRLASDGLYVSSPSTVGLVQIGDHVEVTGAVAEQFGLTQISVAAAADLTVLDEPAIPPTPVKVEWPATDAQRERIESMLIDPVGPFTVTNTFTANQFSEVGLAAGPEPLAQPTDRVPADDTAAVAAIAADNAARLVTLDDGASTNFLGAGRDQVPPYISLTDPVRVGAEVTFNEPMVVDYRFDLWRLQPRHAITDMTPAAERPTFEDTREAAPIDVGGDIRLASFNVLNYFTTLGHETPGCQAFTDRVGDPVTVSGGCDPRGAWDVDDFERQQEKIVAAVNALDAHVVGLMEIESSAALGEQTDEAMASLVAALNADAGTERWAYVPSSSELPPADQLDVITNALIYQPAVVELVGEPRALGTASGPGAAFSNAREPIGQVFAPVGGGEPFFVAVNHFKSKGASDAAGADLDQGDGQGAYNASRVRQAEALRDWTDVVLDDAGIDDAFVIGDFNSYSQEDPLQVLYAAGWSNANVDVGGNVEQSYSFGGLSGSLDHVLANPGAAARVTGTDIWTINAPEAIALEYSRFNYHGALFHAPDPFRSSDHDPVLVGLSAEGDVVPGTVDLTLLSINDFHGRIDANTVAFAGTVEELRTAAGGDDASLFVSVGDNIGASLFASAIQQDQPTIDVLNAIGLDATAVGNHEFDRGFHDLVDRVIGTTEPNAEYAHLGANVYEAGTETPALPEYALFERSGLTVAVIGAVTEETPSLVSPGGVAMLDFGDPVVAVNRVAGELSDGDDANGEADVIVAAFHEGAPFGEQQGTTFEEELARGGAFADIVQQLSAEVDAIFNGHTHVRYAWTAPVPGDEGRTRPIVQTGSYGERIGEIVLTIDPETGEVVAHTQRTVPRTATPAADLIATYPRVAEVDEIVREAIAVADEIGRQPVGSVSADITTAFTGGSYVDGVYTGGTRDDRASESTLGNLVADAFLASLSAPERGGAEIGVVNPGGLRAELLYAPDGVITYAEANSVLPFVNNLWTTTLTGEQFTTLLEQQWQRDAAGNVPTRPYLQLGVSSNVQYTFDPDRPEGERITGVWVDGAPIDPAREYRIGTVSFLLEGGDNFHVLTESTDPADSGLVDRDAWIDHIGASSPLSPDFARRSAIVQGGDVPVEAGTPLAIEVGRLDLTSLGSPVNTTLDVVLGEVGLGSVAVTDGAATVDLVVPAGTPAGPHVLTLVAQPSGTTVSVSIEVTEPTPTGPPEWERGRVYLPGQQVTYDGRIFESLWWTWNQPPGDVWGPWQEIATAPDGTSIWTPSRIFGFGDVVLHEGRRYVALWWTRNHEPGHLWGPWIRIG